MFTQVYFHKTRVAYDIHLRETLKTLLPGSVFPKPTATDLDDFLAWDDWRVLGALAAGKGGEHGKMLATRNHFRRVHNTPEVSSLSDQDALEKIRHKLGGLIVGEESASKSWYKTGTPDIPVVTETGQIVPLSNRSSALANLKANNQTFVYARPENASEARKKVAEVMKSHGFPE